MITFRREKLSECLEDIEGLFDIITEEIKESMPHPIEVDWEYFKRIEELDMLCVITAREDDKLVGYAGFIIDRINHHAALQAMASSIFVHPKHRKFGTAKKLIEYSEKKLAKEYGVKLVLFSVTPIANYSLLLKSLGYFVGDIIHVKHLTEE